MIKDEQFDEVIVNRYTKEECDFSFKINHVISADTLMAQRVNTKRLTLTKSYKVVSYLYGQMQIGYDSYFAEIIGYINPEEPIHLIYHIVYLDNKFIDKYFVDASKSAIGEDEIFVLE